MTSIDTTRRQLAATINENTDVLWSNGSLGEVVGAILAEHAVIPRSELPIVEAHGMGIGIGSKRFGPGNSETRWEYALNNIALALHLEAREDAVEAAAAQAKRAARRDELVIELFNGPGFFYSSIQPGARAAIDRIIDLEQAAA
ncbi:hypothetical protein [Arthrobacter agilis]|uniref:hypothetical protein n=1 Tax=Arthrobacter agilis TaxID=37921 RepID=UPI002780728C|nr:hypothetical protein [Arthrobacter agilis]MDQ0735155.1 hypothetical protein [Arthrobacter agilis]